MLFMAQINSDDRLDDGTGCECIKAIQSQQNNTVPFCFNLTEKHTSKRAQNSRLDSTITNNACDKKP